MLINSEEMNSDLGTKVMNKNPINKRDSNNLNDITNNLILKYDEKFNQLYDKKVLLDSSITNKEEVIIKINEEIFNKETKISVLQYTVILVLLICLLLIANAMGKITMKNLIIISIILFGIYLSIIYFVVYNKVANYTIGKNFRKLRMDMRNYVDNQIDELSPYTCPMECPANSETVEDDSLLHGYKQPTLRIDPQVDVWKYGDIPVGAFTSSELPGSNFYITPKNIPNYRDSPKQIAQNEPKPFFGAPKQVLTYYKCDWMGGQRNGDLPNLESNRYFI
jgi:positive regulator of sigma E activity